MKIIVFALILSFADVSFAETPSVFVDGEIKFAIAELDGYPIFSQEEKDERSAELPVDIGTRAVMPRINDLEPQKFEVNLATCIGKYDKDTNPAGFVNYTDWQECKTRRGLRKKLVILRQEFDASQDLSQADRKEIRARFEWVRTFYNSMP